MPRISKDVMRRLEGVALIAWGCAAFIAPLATGQWSLALLGVPLIVLSVAEARAAFASSRRAEIGAYLPSLLAFLAGIVVFLGPALVAGALVLLLAAGLAIDGAGKIVSAVRQPGEARVPLLVNGATDLVLALLLWWLRTLLGDLRAVGLVIGVYVAAAGWRLLLSPAETSVEVAALPAGEHPDRKLRLPAIPVSERPDIGGDDRHGVELVLTLALVFFLIHLGRMAIADTWLGIVSPFVATAGDLLMTIAAAAFLLLPLRLLWRRLTRPVERLAWSLRLAASNATARMNPVVLWLVGHWLDGRFRVAARLVRARVSLPAALLLLLRLGLPVTAFFVAINPIWGFTWYFNTESWASGIYQKITELRVDRWRVAMVDAVAGAYGEPADELFRIRPAGAEGDFSFLIIGDPGEGDPSQYALISSYLAVARRDDVRFVIVSSDVIYPAGAMSDYERSFYLPFKGIGKPIYAIPGNHDWFDALEGFNANFLEPKAAHAAMEARVEADLRLTSTNRARIDKLIGEAQRLRRLYGVDVGRQRAPFLELQTDGFALVAIDTGILRSVDARQWAWLERALARSRGKLVMAIVGHPRFAAGRDVAADSESLASLYRLLERNGVTVAMAGDTHDLEYYRQPVGTSGDAMHHVVNGGGGAYLSIGSALGFAAPAAVADSAIYPGAVALRTKLATETPLWKRPVWYWIEWLGGWPLAVETLSGVFDFNRAPFYQSFVEVRVEASRRRVVLRLYGVDGPLRWRDLEVRGAVMPRDAVPDDPVELVIPARPR